MNRIKSTYHISVGKWLLKVSKITLEQWPFSLCSNVISLTLNRLLPTGIAIIYFFARLKSHWVYGLRYGHTLGILLSETPLFIAGHFIAGDQHPKNMFQSL